MLKSIMNSSINSVSSTKRMTFKNAGGSNNTLLLLQRPLLTETQAFRLKKKFSSTNSTTRKPSSSRILRATKTPSKESKASETSTPSMTFSRMPQLSENFLMTQKNKLSCSTCERVDLIRPRASTWTSMSFAPSSSLSSCLSRQHKLQSRVSVTMAASHYSRLPSATMRPKAMSTSGKRRCSDFQGL